MTDVCELDSVAMEVQQNLLNALFVMNSSGLFQTTQVSEKRDPFIISFVLEYTYHLLNAILNVKLLDILSELSLIDLRIVKQILNQKLCQLG